MFQNPKLQVYEFESSKRNNLIFYGLASEDGEVGTGIQAFVKIFLSSPGLPSTGVSSKDHPKTAAKYEQTGKN